MILFYLRASSIFKSWVCTLSSTSSNVSLADAISSKLGPLKMSKILILRVYLKINYIYIGIIKYRNLVDRSNRDQLLLATKS